MIKLALMLLGREHLLQLIHQPLLSDDVLQSEYFIPGLPLVFFESLKLFLKLWVSPLTLCHSSVLVNDEIIDAYRCIADALSLQRALDAINDLLLPGFDLQVLELVGLPLHHAIYAVRFLAYPGLYLCAHTLLIFTELPPDVCKLHPRLVELAIVT